MIDQNSLSSNYNGSVINYTPDFQKMRLDYLIDYISAVHHSYMKNMIPIISEYLSQAASSHENNYPQLKSLVKLFSILYKDLKMHIVREEEILFPYLKRLARSETEGLVVEKPYFGSVSRTVSVLMEEHANNDANFLEINQLTNNYTPPEGVCSTFTQAFAFLKEFEEDYLKHKYLEIEILFPRGSALEAKLLNPGRPLSI